jgi:hypothetical protein
MATSDKGGQPQEVPGLRDMKKRGPVMMRHGRLPVNIRHGAYPWEFRGAFEMSTHKPGKGAGF